MNLFEKQSRLNQLFVQSPVNAAYLAGSLANRTSFGHMSDVDIAILLMDQIKADQFLDYQLYFFSELAKRMESDAIDVVILNQASLLLKLQVIKYGQILFTRDEKQRISFETKAVMTTWISRSSMSCKIRRWVGAYMDRCSHWTKRSCRDSSNNCAMR
jgi:predicted nucleotidyltransferase